MFPCFSTYLRTEISRSARSNYAPLLFGTNIFILIMELIKQKPQTCLKKKELFLSHNPDEAKEIERTNKLLFNKLAKIH